MPHLRHEPAGWVETLTSESARVPILMLGILGTVLYQCFMKKDAVCRKKKDDEEVERYAPDDPRRMVDNMRRHAKKKGKYSPKLQKSLGELEDMFENLNEFGESITGQLGEFDEQVSGKVKKSQRR